MNEKACVIGAGSWGTALAMVMARHGRPVTLVARTEATAAAMQAARENSRYLPGIRFPDSLHVTHDRAAAQQDAAVIVLALPCSASLELLPELADLSQPVVAACKGLSPDTHERVDEFMVRFVGEERAAILSGPSFAAEVAEGRPTAITMAAHDLHLARTVATYFDDNSFRIYTSTDMAGVALGGALKNVIAIAAGIAEGLKLGHNATAALVTRGIAEITRLAVACGARQDTLNGLSGLGDLVLTCTGDLSRNRRLGMLLTERLSLEAARQRIGQVTEGERTATAARSLAAELGVDMPITQTVQAILAGDVSPQEAVQALLARPERQE
jgi:glycerol-3-phosphate dehydrogenase (NAD(P)+)